MTGRSVAPDISALEIPIDAWTEPFWDAAGEERLMLPQCGQCGQFRWPPGPFCPNCQSQSVDWAPAGPARIYSFTVVPAESDVFHVPALVEFPEADGVRLLAAIVASSISEIAIGAGLTLAWSQAANAAVPHFRLRNDHAAACLEPLPIDR